MQLRIFKPTDAYGDSLNSYDLLKLIALATMVIDHLGAYIWTDSDIFRVIGRMAFPLFLFLVGYSGNWKIRPDLLLWGAAIIACAQLLHFPLLPLNILISIAVTRCAMYFISRHEMTPRYLTAVYITCIIWFPPFMWTEYSTLSLLFALYGYLQRHKPDTWEARLFLYATQVFHFAMQWYSGQYSAMLTMLLIPIAILTGYILRTFRLQPVQCNRYPIPIRRALQWAARNTLPLYALHVLLLMGMEKVLFPGKFLHFSWF